MGGTSSYRDQPVVWPNNAGADEGRGITPHHAGVPALAERAPGFGQLMAPVEIARLGSTRDVSRVARELKRMWEVRL